MFGVFVCTNTSAALSISYTSPRPANSPNAGSKFGLFGGTSWRRSVWSSKARGSFGWKTSWPVSRWWDRRESVHPIMYLQSAYATALDPGRTAGVRMYQVREAGARVWAAVVDEGTDEGAEGTLTTVGEIWYDDYVRKHLSVPRMRKHRCGGFLFWGRTGDKSCLSSQKFTRIYA